MSTEALLEVEHLSGGYGDLRAVWDVSLAVHEGGTTLLVGPNGAGKTTTLRTIAGLNKLLRGSIRFKGDDITQLPAFARARRGIAYVPEGKRVFTRRTVEENLLLGGYSVSHSRRRLSELMLDVWEMFPVLRDRRSTRAGQLSGGQQQMLAIGQALMSRPSLLMLDEPSGGLSPAAYGEVLNAVKRLHERSVGVLLVEQAIAASLAVADHVTVMDVGRLVFAGEARGLSASEIISRAFVAPARMDAEGRPTTDFQS